MKHSKGYIFSVATILIFVILIACSTTNNIEQTKMVQNTADLQTEAGEKSSFTTADPQAETSEKPSFTAGDI